MIFGFYEFPWGTAVSNMGTGEWTNIIKSPNGEMMIVEGLDVQVTDDGVILSEQGY